MMNITMTIKYFFLKKHRLGHFKRFKKEPKLCECMVSATTTARALKESICIERITQKPTVLIQEPVNGLLALRSTVSIVNSSANPIKIMDDDNDDSNSVARMPSLQDRFYNTSDDKDKYDFKDIYEENEEYKTPKIATKMLLIFPNLLFPMLSLLT
eukprot:6635972-Ditylum_brightwellii.AAC.1